MLTDDQSFPEENNMPMSEPESVETVETVEQNTVEDGGAVAEHEAVMPEEEAVAVEIPAVETETALPDEEDTVEDDMDMPEVVADSQITIEPPAIMEMAAEVAEAVGAEDEYDEEEEPEPEPEIVPTRPKSRRVKRRDARRLANYADLRREQFEEFNSLLETLTHVDELPEAQLDQVRDAIFHADHPFLMTMVGPFSAGKSSVINALLGDAVLDVGPIPTTDHIAILRYGPTAQKTRTGEVSTVFYPADLLQGLSLVDTPGLESVFERHDELTLKFLHRADIVLLVMIATQVLTASNLEFIKNLRGYGKRMIIVVNQIDLLDESDREIVREFVENQSRLHLGIEPTIWLVSAKEALTAYQTEPRDEIIWDASGFADIEEYLDETLDDGERVRQKLETPLLIAQNATRASLQHVRESQAALSTHRKTTDNINAQVVASEKDRQTIIDKLQSDLDHEWQQAIDGGEEAVDELFQFSRALGQTLGGVVEIIGIGAFFRRFRKQTKAQEAFDSHKVREALQRIPEITNKFGPTLEGRDLEDIDGLVDYATTHQKALPLNLQNKVIGKVQTPMSYDRKPLREIRGDLDDIMKAANQFETKRIDRALRTTMMVVALWEFMVILMAVLVGTGEISTSGNMIVVILFLWVLAMFGLALFPIRGMMLKRAYRQRMRALEKQYNEKLSRATHQQIEYGTQLRRDVVAPFTRMVATQAELSDKLKTDLEQHDQKITNIQHSLSALLKA